MSKFKVGDKVKVKHEYFGQNYRKYDIYGQLTIEQLTHPKGYICSGAFGGEATQYYYKEHEIDFSENVPRALIGIESKIYPKDPLGDYVDLDIESKLSNVEEEDISDRELAALAAPLMDYLNRNHNPHTKIIVETDRIEIVQGIRMVKDNTHIRD